MFDQVYLFILFLPARGLCLRVKLLGAEGDVWSGLSIYLISTCQRTLLEGTASKSRGGCLGRFIYLSYFYLPKNFAGGYSS